MKKEEKKTMKGGKGKVMGGGKTPPKASTSVSKPAKKL